MDTKLRQKGRELAQFLKNLSESQRAEGNLRIHEETRAEHAEFTRKYMEGICYLCNQSFDNFDKTQPCTHWLLQPTGFKKNDFPAITKQYGFFQIQSFLRWLANEESFAKNINDLADEGTGKLFEVTIKYRDFEWAFSCSEADYNGHTTKHATHSHYHFQMRVRGHSFIRYNDFHVPFKERDIIQIESMRAEPDLVKHRFAFGEGMNDVLRDDTVEHWLCY